MGKAWEKRDVDEGFWMKSFRTKPPGEIGVHGMIILK
jgi:hypothetical protein